MENSKRKNIYIIIFIITTIIAGSLAVYFGIVADNKQQELDKQIASVKESVSNETANNVTENNVQVKEIEKEVYKELSQENIDKIAKTTIENYLNISLSIVASPHSILTTYLGFYNNFEELNKHMQNINGVEKTDIKYDEFINKITKYMTKEMFEKCNTRKNVAIFKNVDGNVAIAAGGATGGVNYVTSIKCILNSNNEYTYEVKYKSAGYVYTDGSEGYEKIIGENSKTIKVKNVNGTFVISDEK